MGNLESALEHELKDCKDLEDRFCKSLKVHLDHSKMSQVEFGKEFNVTQCIVSRWENHERFPNFGTAMKIADYFGRNVYEFMGLEVPNTDNERSLFNNFLKELGELIARYFRPKSGSISFIDGKSKTDIKYMMTVTYNYKPKSMYPLANALGNQGEYTLSENYLIVNDNIYPEQHFEMLWGYENEHLSLFDFVNDISYGEGRHLDNKKKYESLKGMMNVYAQNRHLFGVLGTLTASKFYWLAYLLAYRNKFEAFQTE